jgi:hypothetical protein
MKVGVLIDLERTLRCTTLRRAVSFLILLRVPYKNNTVNSHHHGINISKPVEHNEEHKYANSIPIMVSRESAKGFMFPGETLTPIGNF